MASVSATSQAYHRKASSATQSLKTAALQVTSDQIWGYPPRGSMIPAVQAYTVPLPSGQKGIEFTTVVSPDPGSPPGQAYWRSGQAGVALVGSHVEIAVTVTKVRYD